VVFVDHGWAHEEECKDKEEAWDAFQQCAEEAISSVIYEGRYIPIPPPAPATTRPSTE
jgi:hypothetical protein